MSGYASNIQRRAGGVKEGVLRWVYPELELRADDVTRAQVRFVGEVLMAERRGEMVPTWAYERLPEIIERMAKG